MSAIPNNPRKAYLLGKRHGCRETLELVAMALMDKHGWTLTDEERADTIHRLAGEIHYYAQEINEGRIRYRDVREILKSEMGVACE